MIRHCYITSLLVFAAAMAAGPAVPPAHAETTDVVVYGATPGGIAAALSAADSGANVLLIEPTRHVGGLITSGLSHTDYRTYEGLTGFYLDFTQRVEQSYREQYGDDSPQVRACRRGVHAEPHVNEAVLLAMLAERSRITVRYQLQLTDVQLANRHIHNITLRAANDQRTEVVAKVFIDGSYEGDLMAMAKVQWRSGCEAQEEYGESLAPETASDELQAYNLRLIATQDPKLRVPVQQPEGYDRADFVGLLPLLREQRVSRVFDYPKDCIFKAHMFPSGLPNGKYDINDVSGGIVRLSMPGANLEWPDGDSAIRAAIHQKHITYNTGLLWFLQNDPEVPERFRKEALTWGWCRDEFADNDHLPYQLYVREARRMVGQYVFTENDVLPLADDARSRFQPDSIAMGDYGPNCHGTRHEGPFYGGKHRGEFYKRVPPYQIPYGVLLPGNVDNLLVPVACSSSHVGFCALRLEPIWAELGSAAGVAAGLAIRSENAISLNDISPEAIQRQLHSRGGATIYVSDVLPSSDLFAAVQWLGARGGLHGLSAPPADGNLRGRHIVSQYYEAFPGHFFEPAKVIDSRLLQRWIDLLPTELQQAASNQLQADATLTRGAVVATLFRLATTSPDASAN
jgi:hypothetical protein